MKNFLLYFEYAFYMLGSLLRKGKVESIRKKKGDKAAEEYINENLLGWAKFFVDKAGIKINIKGIENLPEESCLYVANHQSLFDIPVLLTAIKKPMGFVAKKELEKFKVISGWMREIHCVFMDRSNIRESVKSINEGVENLKNGYSMVIFPEGTRSKDGKLGEFKKGSMKLGIKGEVPIVPVTIDGTYKIREGNEKKQIKPGEVNVVIHKPINTKELTKEEQTNLAGIIKETIGKDLTN